MLKTRHITRLTPESHETLLTILETLPGALFVLDDASIIIYANASAQALLGATPETLVGNSFWRCAPQLVSTALYQAIQKTKQTRALTEVQYVSSVTQRWLHVHLSSTSGGLTLQFHEMGAPAGRQEIVHQRESLYMEVLENVHAGIVFLTPEGIVLDLNKVPLDDAQIRREEVVGKPLVEGPWWSFSPPSQAQLRAAIKRASRGETVRFETPIHPREGMELHLEVAITPHRDADHHVEYLVMAGIDITARKRAEAEFHTLIDAIPQQVWTMRADGYIDYYNQRWFDYTGLSTEQAQGDGWIQCLHPDDQQRIQDAWQTSRKTGTLFETEQRLRQGTSGAYHWFLARAMPMRDKTGQIIKWFGTCTDIHDKKQAEDEIRVLVDAIPHHVWIKHPDGSAEYSNQRWCDYTNMTAEQTQGYGWLQAIYPDDQQRVLEGWQRSVQTGMPYEAELRMCHGPTGEYRWFLVRAMLHKDAQGTPLKWFGTCTDIDDRKRAEQQLKESRESLRVLTETVPQLVWVRRPDGLLEYVNQRYRDYTGLMLEQIQSDPWAYLQFFHPDDSESHRAHLQHALDTGEMYEHEQRLRNGQTGAYRWFLARAMPVRDDAGQIIKWFGTCTDIDEQKQAEQRIKASEENWRVLAETLPQLVWTTQPDGRVDYCNQRYCDLTQADFEQIRDYGWRQFLHPEDAEHTLALRQQSLATGELFENECRIRDGRTGAYRWFLARALPVRDTTGQILKWFGTCTDIEEQKQAEQQLKTSEQNFRTLAEMVPQLVWTMWPDGRLDYTNQRYRDVTQANLTLEGDDLWRQFVHPEDIERTLALRHQLLRIGEIYENEYRLKDGRTGEYRWYLTRALPVRDEAGQIIKWFGTGTDIDDQKRVEEALRQSQEQANVLMNSNIIGIFVGEREQIVDANDTFLRMTGYTREDLRAGRMNWLHMTPPDYLARSLEARQELDAQQSITPYEKEYVCKDGSRLPVLVGAVLLEHHSSQAITFVLDNSARKELEQRKDDFISMASHELRNPLTALKLHTTLLYRQLAKQGLQASALSSMETQINKLTRLVEELLDVSKIQAGRLEYVQETVDLDALLREIVDTMQQTNPSHTILMRGVVQTNLMADRDRLGQVFTNLLSNAIKYSPGAETVEMDLSASAEAVTIRVQDHGLGIPREQRDKIFERFYRAAGPRQRAIPGLGMGLYIVAEIVKHHGGTITVESEVGKGSTFTVTLPMRREA
ncbi:histidine kinase [Ktedonobacter sp. SOSP1-52]|uniref:PAS domain S-box protein n=1 Tax=Ktedonobacter sp. SOSP1-52 TaxID=2778366 RepID=UPI001915224D|nr:PAS domain S-box protein [Ktedonobacter sp. SOSP1-52]GHO61138.1 histidine kinase [Ktedonobacter sp. SOSP1-52]